MVGYIRIATLASIADRIGYAPFAVAFRRRARVGHRPAGRAWRSFQAAVQAVERFLPRRDRDGSRPTNGNQSHLHRHGTAICDLPFVLLIDAGTASAAEVLAAAFKEHDRAVLVGQTTYGKAAVQQIIPLDAGGGVRLTLARLFGPGGKSFHGIGISPHVSEPVAERQLDVAFEQAGKLIGQK